jgi:DNA gyrase subunit B
LEKERVNIEVDLFDSDRYSADKIEVLEGLEAVRKRPGMYIGSTGIKGLHHLVWEVVDNSIDEFLAGFGEKIKIIVHKDNSVSVEDWGRGIPADIHKDTGRPATEIVLTTLHAGGKFNNNSYKVAGGLHGVGVSVVNALSEKLVIETYWEGNMYTQTYKKGLPVNDLSKKGKTKKSGTIITFKPDSAIFDTTNFKFETLSHRFKQSAYLNKDLTLILEDERNNKKETFQYDGGIKAFIEYLNKNRSLLYDEIIYNEDSIDEYELEFAIQYNQGYSERIFSYANNINTVDGGYHLTGFKSALTKAVNNFAKKNNLLPKNINGLNGHDVREGITAVVNVKLPNPQFEGQTKSKLGNSELRSIVEKSAYDYLSLYLDTSPELGKAIVYKGLKSVRARQASKKARELTKRKSVLSSSSLPGKLADCASKKAEGSELFIVEGDSAGGSAKQARNRHNQAILPLKGKILNVERARLDKILNNTEVASIITALGTSIGEDFNLDDLRYEKVIIMTDADIDGAHISTLILTLFYRYMQELIDEGHIYLARPPLYKVTYRKNSQYIFDEKALKEYREEHGSGNFSIQRYKGLGEMNPDQLWDTTMSPETRKLQKVEVNDEIEADDVFTKLMGSNSKLRKTFIFNNADLATEIDI